MSSLRSTVSATACVHPRRSCSTTSSMGAVSIFRALSTSAVEEPTAVIVEGLYDEMLNAIGNRFHAMGLPSFAFAELLGFRGGIQM